MTRAPSLLVLLTALGLAACGGPRMDTSQMTAAQPLSLDTILAASADQPDYRLGAGDKLNIQVYQVEDLTFEEMVVDSSGSIQLPLIGAVRVAGLTATQSAETIAGRLSQRYLRDPQVTVTVVEAASQKITVDGAVTKPGVYVMRGSTTLLQAVAMAEGPGPVADLSKVAIFRTIDGQRSVAVFDLAAIRRGRAADPQVQGDDIIVVDSSRTRSILREVIAALPGLSVFRPY